MASPAYYLSALPVVLLDADFLMMPFQLGIDALEEIKNLLSGKVEFVVLSATLEELRGLAASPHPKRRKLASLALRLSERCRRIEAQPRVGETVDDLLVRLAKENSWIVATNDADLRRKLRAASVPRIFVRKRRRLEIEGLP